LLKTVFSELKGGRLVGRKGRKGKEGHEEDWKMEEERREDYIRSSVCVIEMNGFIITSSYKKFSIFVKIE
jgi:hypothetical protein